jgi:hypothetical protein
MRVRGDVIAQDTCLEPEALGKSAYELLVGLGLLATQEMVDVQHAYDALAKRALRQ